ncbi:MAG: serine O-acetyltransferase [Treponema sp.]|jgi:serine O-acetyltransferase|nr:serine O-acetyltransferase [Treponema sp.]
MYCWDLLKEKAKKLAGKEPALAKFLGDLIIDRVDFNDGLAALLANKCLFLHEAVNLSSIIRETLEKDPWIPEAAVYDLAAIVDKDAATNDFLVPFLFYKGFHSLELYRIAHFLWGEKRKHLAYYIQSRVSQLYGVDIHPAAQIGRGIFIDHATAIVVGETAVIEDNVSLLHQVTLGGTGKETGKRHPTIRRDCLLGAGSTILGSIEIGEGSVVGAGSVVLHSVPPHSLAAGVPAELKGSVPVKVPSNLMDQIFDSYQ